MEPSQRIVIVLPLDELWEDQGSILAERIRYLSEAEIRELLRAGPVRFVVADVGLALKWVPDESCFNYWKDRVSGHLADAERPLNLGAFPGESCFFASEWTLAGSKPIILLERIH